MDGTEGTEITILDAEEVLVDGSWEVSTSASSRCKLSFVKLSVIESDTFSSLSRFSADNVGDSVALTLTSSLFGSVPNLLYSLELVRRSLLSPLLILLFV